MRTKSGLIYPKKGSAEAKAWGARMQALRGKKRRRKVIRIHKKNPAKGKRNPIAIYNKPGMRSIRYDPKMVIYDELIEIRARKNSGPERGKYYHRFVTPAQVIGAEHGSLVILPDKDGKPLWGRS